MRHDLYQAETARIAADQSAVLAQAREILLTGRALSMLEQNGALHALQVLVENSIGKAKQILKIHRLNVPVSAYDAFKSLVNVGHLPENDLTAWNAAIGLRNRIVHDYMNIDMDQVLAIITSGKDQLMVDFLMREMPQADVL